jgi:hypothetical protein
MSKSLSTKGYDFGRLSYETIGACIEVQRQLGVHCMEVDYQRALGLALPKRGLQFQLRRWVGGFQKMDFAIKL